MSSSLINVLAVPAFLFRPSVAIFCMFHLSHHVLVKRILTRISQPSELCNGLLENCSFLSQSLFNAQRRWLSVSGVTWRWVTTHSQQSCPQDETWPWHDLGTHTWPMTGSSRTQHAATQHLSLVSTQRNARNAHECTLVLSLTCGRCVACVSCVLSCFSCDRCVGCKPGFTSTRPVTNSIEAPVEGDMGDKYFSLPRPPSKSLRHIRPKFSRIWNTHILKAPGRRPLPSYWMTGVAGLYKGVFC